MSSLSKDFLYNQLIATQVTNAVVVTADANSASVDMLGYNSLAFVVNVGIEGDTLSGSVKFDLEIEESADDSTFADSAAADVWSKSITAAGAAASTPWATLDAIAEAPAQHVCHYLGTARYVRCVINATGTHTNGTPIGITALRGKADTLPAT